MKISIKLSAKQMNTLVFAFNSLSHIPVNSRDVRVARSILDKVVLRLRKKYLDVQCEHKTLFYKPKQYSISFEYFEAHYVENFITVMEDFPMNEYDRNVLRLIKTNLNQQLV